MVLMNKILFRWQSAVKEACSRQPNDRFRHLGRKTDAIQWQTFEAIIPDQLIRGRHRRRRLDLGRQAARSGRAAGPAEHSRRHLDLEICPGGLSEALRHVGFQADLGCGQGLDPHRRLGKGAQRTVGHDRAFRRRRRRCRIGGRWSGPLRGSLGHQGRVGADPR